MKKFAKTVLIGLICGFMLYFIAESIFSAMEKQIEIDRQQAKKHQTQTC